MSSRLLNLPAGDASAGRATLQHPLPPVPDLPLYAAAFLLDVALGMTMTALPWLVANQYHASPQILGGIASTATAVYTIVALSAGLLARRLAPLPRMLVATVGAALCYVAAVAFHSLAALAGTWCLSWLLMGFFWPALQAQLCAGCGGDEIQKRLTRFNLSWSVGILTGPALAGQLYPRSPFLPFTAATVLSVIVSLIVALGVGRSGAPWRVAAPAGPDLPVHETTHQPGSTLILPAAWCGHFASYFCLSVVRTFFPLLATSRGIPETLQGYLLLELGVFQATAFFLVPHVQRRLSPAAIIPGGLTLVTAGMLLLTWPGLPMQILALALVGFGIGATYVVSIYHSLHSNRPSHNAGIHEGIVGGSGIFGGLMGGYAATHHGLRSPFPLGAAVVLLLAVPAGAILLMASRARQQ